MQSDPLPPTPEGWEGGLDPEYDLSGKTRYPPQPGRLSGPKIAVGYGSGRNRVGRRANSFETPGIGYFINRHQDVLTQSFYCYVSFQFISSLVRKMHLYQSQSKT